jgi:FdhD protein
MIPKGPQLEPVQIWKVNGANDARRRDAVAVEEPLEIRLIFRQNARWVERSISITMRTPGHDFELAVGFLFSEGIIRSHRDIEEVNYCVGLDKADQEYNIVNVRLKPGVAFDAKRLERHFYTTSSCGICGKASLEALAIQGCSLIPTGGLQVARQIVSGLPETLRAAQAVFERTGGLHAAGLFDCNGQLISLREDVGRHNAVDKLVGEQLLNEKIPLSEQILLVSGRASFELMQKALMARVPIVAAVGAPSSLAVALANEYGMTLAGFVRGDSFNIYTGAERIIHSSDPSPMRD